jgi:hypothetical protein
MAKVLAAFLFAFTVIAFGHSKFINRLKHKNKKLESNFIDKFGSDAVEGNKYLSAAEKEIIELKRKLNEAKKTGFPTELLNKDAHIRIIAGIDALMEQCRLQIIKRDRVKVLADNNASASGIRKKSSGIPEVSFLSCSYTSEGSFRSVYRFLAAVNKMKQPFFVSNIILKRKSDSSYITFNFNLKIPYIKK